MYHRGVSTDNLIDQLVNFYYNVDSFQERYMPEDRVRRIYEILLNRNRLHLFTDATGVLNGYGESFRLTYEQFGRVVCGYNLYDKLEDEDIEHGPIAILMNVCILPEWRKSNVIKILRNDFFSRNFSAKYFTGHAKRKKHSPWKMFTKQEAYNKWANQLQEAS